MSSPLRIFLFFFTSFLSYLPRVKVKITNEWTYICFHGIEENVAKKLEQNLKRLHEQKKNLFIKLFLQAEKVLNFTVICIPFTSFRVYEVVRQFISLIQLLSYFFSYKISFLIRIRRDLNCYCVYDKLNICVKCRTYLVIFENGN